MTIVAEDTDTARHVCLVGAGYISSTHAEALQRLPGVQLTAVVDPNEEARCRLARRFSVQHVFASVDAALDAGSFDTAHILVPPPLHDIVAQPLIEAGIPTLLEKPIAASTERARRLVEKSAEKGVILGVNQNLVYHPSFVRLRTALASGTIGNPRFLSYTYHVPLRQLAARQFGHWIFDKPQNILLEQAVHPLSQIVVLAGAVKDLRCAAGPPIEVAPGQPFYPRLGALLQCERYPAQLHFAVGEEFPVWQLTVIGDDGVLVADMITNRFHAEWRTRWAGAVDNLVSGWRTGGAIVRESSRSFVDDALAILRPSRGSDAYIQSMRAGIGAFYTALNRRESPELGADFGAALVALCEKIADAAYAKPVPPPLSARTVSAKTAEADVAVLGGTGFIGRHLVAELVARGKRVAVMARSIGGLPAIFEDPHIMVVRGDIGNEAEVASAIGSAPIVVNLAHGGSVGSWEETYRAMVGGAETVARVCLQKKVRRLVHVSSIAALYLGPQSVPVTGETPPDPRAERRGDYARAKVLCERMLVDLHAEKGLPVVILRPGLVVGAGGPPLHSGLGFYNNEQHCLGWDRGGHPLPFVLAADVAIAVATACDADSIDGRAFNLVGDVRLDARDYISALAAALHRPLYFHPQSPFRLWLIEQVKRVLKLVGGRRASAPTLRDLRSRGLSAEFDCGDTKEALDWRPVADREAFLASAFSAIRV